MEIPYMIKFAIEVPKGIEEWAKVAVSCKGDAKCIDLDAAFPSSKKIEIEWQNQLHSFFSFSIKQ